MRLNEIGLVNGLGILANDFASILESINKTNNPEIKRHVEQYIEDYRESVKDVKLDIFQNGEVERNIIRLRKAGGLI